LLTIALDKLIPRHNQIAAEMVSRHPAKGGDWGKKQPEMI
jgi:hypothetical protein